MSRKRAATSALDTPGADTPGTVNKPRVDRVVVDVGGTLFTTSASTLAGSSAYFQRIFSDRWDAGDSCFLDRDPEPFAVLLSYMRSGLLKLPEADAALSCRVLHEAEFLGVDSLLVEVKAQAQRHLHAAWEGSDAEAAAAFDAEHGGLAESMRAGVLPARYFAAPPPAKRNVLQLMPAPAGLRIKVGWVRRGSVIQPGSPKVRVASFPVQSLALVETPAHFRNNESTVSHLDAYVTAPHMMKEHGNVEHGSVLASEAYGDQTRWFEFEPMPAKKELILLPEGCNLRCELWNDKDDHSLGTFERSVSLLCRSVYDGVSSMEAVDLEADDDNGQVELIFPHEWSNFCKFVM